MPVSVWCARFAVPLVDSTRAAHGPLKSGQAEARVQTVFTLPYLWHLKRICQCPTALLGWFLVLSAQYTRSCNWNTLQAAADHAGQAATEQSVTIRVSTCNSHMLSGCSLSRLLLQQHYGCNSTVEGLKSYIHQFPSAQATSTAGLSLQPSSAT